MSKPIIRVRLFFVWQASQEARWLEHMAEQGFALTYAIPFIYFFKRQQPEKVFFCHDYATVKKQDLDNYLQLYRDSGWQPVMRYGKWFYFKSEENQQVFSDKQLLQRKGVGIIRGFLTIFIAAFLVNFILLLVAYLLANNAVFDTLKSTTAITLFYTILLAALWWWRKSKLE